MKKRIISTILLLCLSLSLCVVAYASPYSDTKGEDYDPCVITWNYPDPMTGSDYNTPQTAFADTPVTKPAIVPYDDLMWVNKDDPTDFFDPTNPYPPTKDVTYVPLFTITWDNPTEPDVVEHVPYQQPVYMPTGDMLEGDLENHPWMDENGTPYAPHTAYRDETYSCVFIINWNYHDPINGDTTKMVLTHAGTPVTKPADLPDDLMDRIWVNKDDPTDFFDPTNPYPPTKDVTYVPLFTITWDNPREPDVVEHVPYQQPVYMPTGNMLEGDLENHPWMDENGNRYFVIHPATKDETFKPAYDITWNYPDPTEGDKTVTDPTPYDEDVTPPIDDPTIEWVDENGDPFVPGKPTGDKTYVPVYTITWGDPDINTPYHVDKVPYKQPVKKPSDEVLPDAVDNKPNDDWHDKVGNTPFAEHPATKNESYVPLFNITWKPENGDPDRTEKVSQGVTSAYDDTDPTVNPTKSGYTFQGWDPVPYPADKDQVYTAKYKHRSSGGGGGGDTSPVVSFVWIFNSKTISCTVSASTATVVFCATYDDYGRFIGVEVRMMDAGASQALTFTPDGGAANAKLMLVDTSCTPLCGSESVELSAN